MTTAALMTGPLDGVAAVSLEAECSLETFMNKVQMVLEQMDDKQGVLILADLLGGTPANVAASLAKCSNVQVVTGINLPMLLEVYMVRQTADLQALTELAIQAGRGAVQCLTGI